MKEIIRKVSLEGLYNALFTIGILLITLGVGFIETGATEFSKGAETILMGLGLIALGVFIYWLKSKEVEHG